MIKRISFTLAAWIIFASAFNFIYGFLAKDYYMKLDVIDRETAQSSQGFFVPNQKKTLLFPGMKPYRIKVNQLGFHRLCGYMSAISIPDGFIRLIIPAFGKF